MMIVDMKPGTVFLAKSYLDGDSGNLIPYLKLAEQKALNLGTYIAFPCNREMQFTTIDSDRIFASITQYIDHLRSSL